MLAVIVGISVATVPADLRVVAEQGDNPILGVFVRVITTSNRSIYAQFGGKGDKDAITPFEFFYQLQTDDGKRDITVDGMKWMSTE